MTGEPPEDQELGFALALLRGDRAAAEGSRAIAMIQSAAAKGDAEAISMTALLETMSGAGPQRWSSALDLLLRAAELGSKSARSQLAVLDGRGPDEPCADWPHLRARLSPEKLLAIPPKQQLSDSPRILAFPGLASEAECKWIIARARDRLQPAKVFSKGSSDQIHNPARDNKAIAFQLADMDVVIELLRARISAATRLPVPIFETTQVLNYAVGEQFRPHHDFLDPDVPGFADQLRSFGQRIATVLVYLNDDYSGGETVFPKLDLSFRGRTGDALFFTNVDRSGRGDPLTTHAGAPPTSGEKWVLSQWIRDRIPSPAGAKR